MILYRGNCFLYQKRNLVSKRPVVIG